MKKEIKLQSQTKYKPEKEEKQNFIEILTVISQFHFYFKCFRSMVALQGSGSVKIFEFGLTLTLQKSFKMHQAMVLLFLLYYNQLKRT